MKTRFYLLFLSFLLSSNLWAQEERNVSFDNNQSLYFEFFGSALIYSINFEQLTSNNLSYRIGFSALPDFDLLDSGILLPLSTSYLFQTSKEPTFLELGVSGTLLVEDISFPFIGAIIGFRGYNPNLKGAFWRLSFTPFYNTIDSETGLWGGLSIGKVF